MLVTGTGMMLQMASSNTILQTVVEEDKRGRVMSLFSMAYFGTLPFGSLFAGALAGRLGVTEHHLDFGTRVQLRCRLRSFCTRYPA